MLKKVSQNIQKKKIRCPNCKNEIEFSGTIGDIMVINCKACNKKWKVEVKNSLTEIFSWDSSLDLGENLTIIKRRFKALPLQTKVSIYLMFFIINLFIVVLSIYFKVRF